MRKIRNMFRYLQTGIALLLAGGRLITVCAAILGGQGARVLAAPANDAPAAYRDGVVLLSFNDGLTPAQQSVILANIGASEIKVIGVGVHVVNVGAGRVFGAIQSLKTRGEIRYVEPDYLQSLDGGPLPNDPNLGTQWAFRNTGQIVNGTVGTSGADNRATAAWGVTTGGNSVVLAILDTGVQYSHPDLAANMWNNPGGIGGCAAGTHGYNVLTATCDPMDDDTAYGGHGTHVAGILGAVTNNAQGVVGVNWTTSIMAVKWVAAANSGATSDLITAMDWVINAKKAGVNVRGINDSATWPGTAFSQALSDELDLLGTNDILFTTAAGNTAQNNDSVPRYPCSYNRANMICVAATDQNDNLWSSSNYGKTTVNLAAPGVNIYSTLRVSNYGFVSGTSMAAPQALGTAGLILSFGYQPVATLKSMILNSVDPLPSLTNFVATGGRLNICKAVPGCSTATTSTPTNAALPVINGILQYGSILGGSTGRWSGVPTSFAYQWYRCDSGGANCSAIAGATSEGYTPLASADVGATLRVSVTASNGSGSGAAQSAATGIIASATSPFTITSSIQGGTISGIVPWQATPGQGVNLVQFYVDGVLRQTDSSSPYTYNLDTTTLSNGAHVLGLRALSTDNRTYGFYGTTMTVGSGPIITTSSLPGGTQNAFYSAALAVAGGTTPYSWSVISGSLPAGLTLGSSSGVISGTPTATGTGNFTVQVRDTNSVTASKPFSITINPGGGAGGISLAQSNAVEGSGVGSVSVAFPSGNTAGNMIIAFVRMSTTSQTVQVTDSAGNVYADAISQAQTTDGHQVHIFYAKNIGGGANTVKATFSATNNHPWLAIYEYSGLNITNPLDKTAHAQGSSSSPNTGATATTANANELVFAGVGFANAYPGTATAGSGFILQQQDTGTSRAATEAAVVSTTGAFAGSFSLSSATTWSTVVATFSSSAVTSSPSITTSSLPAGTQNASYSTTLSATGGLTPYTWSVISGSLPAGLTLGNGSGLISGTPTVPGTSNFTVQVRDANSATATKPLSITINPSAGGGGIGLVQSNAVEGTGVGSVSVAFSSANTAGNLIIAFVRMSTTTQTVQVTDTTGNIYTDAVSQAQTTDGHQIHIFYAKNINAGSNTVKATFSATNNHPWLAIYEYSGLNATNPLDQIAHAQGATSSPSSGPTAVTTSAYELVFAAAGFPASFGGTAAAGGGYVLQQQDTGTSRAVCETASVTSKGSYAGTFSLSATTNWSAVTATFKP